jgi:hypothetical protein
MSVVIYADAEALVKAWLLTTDVAPLLTRDDGGVSIFMAMPASAPLPALVLTRAGGSPRPGKDLPEEEARMRFHCWGRSRAQAITIARTLVGECESLARTGGFDDGGARLAAMAVVSLFWLPDRESDTARYVVDARALTIAT